MALDVSGIGARRTPPGFLDNSRPQAMQEADRLFERFTIRGGNTPTIALSIANTLGIMVKNARHTSLDDFWRSVETNFNKGIELTTKAETDIGRFNTAFSLFYSAIDAIDTQSIDSGEFSALQEIWNESKRYASSRVAEYQSDKDKRIIARIIKTTDQRLNKVGKSINEKIENGQMLGNAVTVALF